MAVQKYTKYVAHPIFLTILRIPWHEVQGEGTGEDEQDMEAMKEEDDEDDEDEEPTHRPTAPLPKPGEDGFKQFRFHLG